MKKRDLYDDLTTPYSEKMDRECPWNIYPRPAMTRDSFICLNGEWDFAVTDGNAPDQYSERILVPFPPESALSGIGRSVTPGDAMYYRRSFELDCDLKASKVLLHFGAVDTHCAVTLNGISVGRHSGGYLPFSFDVTDALRLQNILEVTVTDPLDGVYPYGKQTKTPGGMWYTPVSGIWQTVWLEIVPENYIERLAVTSYVDRAEITVLGGSEHKKLTLESGECFEFDGDKVTVVPAEIINWTPENPKLYRFTLECGDDLVRSYFALREISCAKENGIPRLCLNGKPTLFCGLLDQGYFPDGIFLPATEEGYREDILRAKAMGFNMLRKHIKIEPEIFYALCDELGMVVFQDMVNNGGYSFILDTALPTVGIKRAPDNIRHRDPETRKVFTEQMLLTQKHLGFFPSVLYYTIFNEGWGQFKADEAYELAKATDPTRIYDATSGWFVRSKSDVDSRHVYFKPIKLGRRGDRPMVISEFGGYAHRVEGHLFGKENYGYRMYSEREEFEAGFRRLYEEEVLPLISEGICALVYTQLSDVEDETNGLITYDRRVIKLDVDKTRELMEQLYRSI